MYYKLSQNGKEKNINKRWRPLAMSHCRLLRPSCKQIKIGIGQLEVLHQVEGLGHLAHPRFSKVHQEEVLVEVVDLVETLYLMGNQNSHLKKHLVDIRQFSTIIRVQTLLLVVLQSQSLVIKKYSMIHKETVCARKFQNQTKLRVQGTNCTHKYQSR